MLSLFYRQFSASLFFVIVAANSAACTFGNAKDTQSERTTVRIDGSSTVFPITEIAAEHFGKLHKNVRVTVGVSGTGGGFNKFANNQIDIANASRLIKTKEIKKAKKNGVEYEKFDVAFDGISVIVHKKNNFAKQLTFEQLRALWTAGSKVKTWKDLNPSWPSDKINLYGPSPENGTFDFFKEAVVGKKGAIRSDYTATEDDNVIVSGVSSDKNALGYFGFAYYTENKTRLGVVALVKDGSKPVTPSFATIQDNSYPLSRPIYVYVNKKSVAKKSVQDFLEYTLENADTFVPKVGYISLGKTNYKKSIAALNTLATKVKYAVKK